jgi:hypothetical protein
MRGLAQTERAEGRRRRSPRRGSGGEARTARVLAATAELPERPACCSRGTSTTSPNGHSHALAARRPWPRRPTAVPGAAEAIAETA